MEISNHDILFSTRRSCVICGFKSLSKLIELNGFPVYMGCTEQEYHKDLFFDQQWVICDECGCVQLKKLVNPSLLYSDNHSSGAIGDTWKKHHTEFATYIQRFKPQDICEIGGAHGFLAKTILKENKLIDYLMIEPSVSSVVSGVRYINGFVEDNYEILTNFHHIVHSHVLEHIYEPRLFLFEITKRMSTNALMHFSIPNIERLIKTKGTNSLNFEHTYYLHPIQLKILMKNLGLEIVEFQKFEEHSFFVTVKKVSHFYEDQIPSIYQKGTEFRKMIEEINVFSQRIDILLDQNQHTMYLFGAHVFSQSIYMELNSRYKSSLRIIDNAESKQGKRLYGTDLKVYAPEILRGEKNIVVALRASHYQEEVRNQILKINSNVTIIE